MLRLLFRYSLTTILALAAMLTGEWTLVNLVTGSTAGPRDPIVFQLPGFGSWSATKMHIDLVIRVLVTLGALTALNTFEALDLYLPTRKARAFRKAFFEREKVRWIEAVGSDVRINVMYARFLRFGWAWNHGFNPSNNAHLDANLQRDRDPDCVAASLARRTSPCSCPSETVVPTEEPPTMDTNETKMPPYGVVRDVPPSKEARPLAEILKDPPSPPK